MSSAHEIDERLAAEEVTPLQDDEMPYVEACKAAISEEQRKLFTDLDYICVVRGYATYEPRLEETVKAFKEIAEWREKVNYKMYLKERLPQDEEFYHYWPEYIYGEDKYGHPLVAMHFSEMQTDKLGAFDEQHMLRMQGQKQTLYTHYKEVLSAKRGEQRYKYSVVMDLKGAGMSVLGGKKRGIIKSIFSVGADHFPESIWKIYVVNTPMIFRAVWSIVKPWIHPITQAKVNILGGAKDASKVLKEHGFTTDALPEWMNGTREPLPTFDYLLQTIEANSPTSDSGSPAGGASSGAAAGTGGGGGGEGVDGEVDAASVRVGRLARV